MSILCFNADPNIVNGKGETALAKACFQGSFELLKLLIDHKAKANCKLLTQSLTKGITEKFGVQIEPIGLAVINNNFDVIKLLIETAENKQQMKNTALSYALDADNKETILGLIELGADVNTVSKRDGQTALMKAVVKYAPHEVGTLIKLGANVNHVDNVGNTSVYLLTSNRTQSKLVRNASYNTTVWSYTSDTCQILRLFSTAKAIDKDGRSINQAKKLLDSLYTVTCTMYKCAEYRNFEDRPFFDFLDTAINELSKMETQQPLAASPKPQPSTTNSNDSCLIS